MIFFSRIYYMRQPVLPAGIVVCPKVAAITKKRAFAALFCVLKYKN